MKMFRLPSGNLIDPESVVTAKTKSSGYIELTFSNGDKICIAMNIGDYSDRIIELGVTVVDL